MPEDKRIYFIAGLPRSGSTLLANILVQNPQVHVTSTSGIVDMLVLVRNAWDRLREFQALDRAASESIKRNVLRGMLRSYFEHLPKPICIDKNRRWTEYLELAAELLGGRDKVRVIVTVRDVRDVLASFETLHRKTAALGQAPFEAERGAAFKTALGRLEMLLEEERAVGRPYHGLRDAVTRGWRNNMLIVDYAELTANPRETLESVYAFIGERPYAHAFDQVEQLIVEDDFAYGYKDLHVIRTKVEPQQPSWPRVYDAAVTESETWKRVEAMAQFWKRWL